VVFRDLMSPSTDSDDPTSLSGPASAVLKFLVFSGAALDVLGAVFALISLLSLCKTTKTIHEAKHQVCCDIWDTYDATRVPDYCIPLRFPDDLRSLLHIMDHHSNFHFAHFLVFNAGMAFFLVSICFVIFFAVATRALSVVAGISMMVFAIMMNLLMVVGIMRCTGRYWRKFLSYAACSFRIWLDSLKKPALQEKVV
jgi:hypothetical protein